MSKIEFVSSGHEQLFQRAMEISGEQELSALLTVIKEVIHFDMLAALYDSGHLKDMTFQGGTCLHMVHDSARLSEDLDFTTQKPLNGDTVKAITASLEEYLSRVYELPVTVKPPKRDSLDIGGDVDVLAWTVKIDLLPKQREIPMQKIKLEIASVPSHTRTLESARPKLANPLAAVPRSQIPIYAQDLTEIMADKVIAFANRPGERIKSRDLFDMLWLAQRNIKPSGVLIQKKIEDYRIDDFEGKLKARVAKLDAPETKKAFYDEMSRFLSSFDTARLLDKPEFIELVMKNAAEISAETLEALHRLEKGDSPSDDLHSSNVFKI